MIVSIDWLKEFVDITETPDKLAELLSSTGLEAEVGSTPHELPGIVIGQVETAEKHPNADKLKLCTVNDGKTVHQVVCGAPNVDAGQKIVFAPVGSTLPGNLKLKKANIRGVESHGMICSERELQISDEHDGIMVLPDDLNPGDDFMSAYGHKYLSIELDITPNRPDAFSHQGVARDIACATGRKFKPLGIESIKPKGNEALSISMDNPDDCPRYIGGIVKNVTVGPSPDWMVEKLKASGQRSINNLVDISNYVLLEMGHPTHIFDYDKLAQKEILVRRAKKSETITTLDEANHKLNEMHLLITDGKSPIALAGIMGGLDSAVTDDTTTVIVESAYFDPVTTRKSAKSLQMNTDASKRFERGADPNGAEKGFCRVVELLEELAGGELVSDMVDPYPQKIESSEINLRKSELDLILGIEVDSSEVERILYSLGFDCSNSENGWTCMPPSYRPDVEREIDIIEEIARMVGYDDIPSDENIYGTFRYTEPDSESNLDTIRSTLAGFGFHQVYANSLQNEQCASLTGISPVKMMNPLSQEMAYLRTSLLPGLMKDADFNVKHGTTDFRLFELANIHEQVEKGFEGIKEFKHLAGIVYGNEKNTSVHSDESQEGLFTLKGYLDGLFSDKYGMRLELKRGDHAGFDYTQTILINRQEVGAMGRLSNDWKSALDLDLSDTYGFEINLEPILKMMRGKKKFKPISPYPKVPRDLNLVMPETQNVGPIADMMLRKGRNLIVEANPINIFVDETALGAGMKSVTFSLEFQHSSKTLEDKDVNSVIDDIIRVAEADFHAKLRS